MTSREESVTWQLCKAATARRAPYWAMVFETYIDETGVHEGAPVTGVAAYIATGEQWFQFEQAWLGVLRKPEFNVEAFHATDYENGWGEFKGWDATKKVSFAKCLFPVLAANTWVGQGYAVVNQDWDDALQGHDLLRSLMGTPYMGCVQRVLEILLELFRPMPMDHRIAVFFENNDSSGDILRLWNNWLKKHDPQDRLITVNFGGKKDFVPLQAADAFAYEVYKELDNLRFDKGRPRRKSLEVMDSVGNIRARIWDRQNLPKAVARLERTLDLDGLATLQKKGPR